MTEDLWPAPRADRPLHGDITVPGSKSATNRYLALSAQATSPTTLRGALQARDTDLMMEAISALGATVERTGEDVTVTPGPPTAGRVRIDCGLAGTVMRFIPPLAALTHATVTLDGDEGARRRPLAPLLDALADLDVVVEHADGFLPITIRGAGKVRGGDVEVDPSTSSQYLSALLLAAPSFALGLTLRATGPVPSSPYLEMTVNALRTFGATVTQPDARTWVVEPGQLTGGQVAVEPDLSNAAVFLAAGAVSGGRVGINHWPRTTAQPGAQFPALLERMGATVDWEGETLYVTGPESHTLWGLEADLSDVGEIVPTLAAVCALAQTPSRLTGIAHLRGHETDRLRALATEINRMGGQCRELEDGLEIQPAMLHGAELESYEDHRMATFGAIVGLRVDGVSVRNIATTSKTLPGFVGLWDELVAAP